MVGRRRRRRREDGDCTESLYSLYNPGMVGGGGWWRIILDSQLHQHIPTLRYSQILKYPPYNRKITVCNLNLIFQRLWNNCSIFTIVDLFDRYQKLCNPHPEIPPTWLTLSAKCFVFQTAKDGEEGRFLPSGADQDCVGGTGEVSEPHACRPRSLRTGGVQGSHTGTLTHSL